MDGYSICFNEWVLDKDIKNELGLLCIISSFCARDGVCFATNDYLATLFETDETTISKKLKKLTDKNYISIEYKKIGNVVSERKITIPRLSRCQKYQPPLAKMPTAVGENAKGNNNINNISPDNNIIINNNILSAPKGFVKPSVEDVKAYCEEKGYAFDPESFVAYYDSNGWMVGKSKMKNWKAACTTWAKNGFSRKEEKQKEFYW